MGCGSNTNISIWRDNWLPIRAGGKIRNSLINNLVSLVADLIDQNVKCWKEDVVNSIFTLEEAEAIKCIPLSRTVEKDMLVWKEDNSCKYSIRSGYKSVIDRYSTDGNLQEQN